MSRPTPLIKFDVCIYKKNGMPQDEFMKWATTEYPVKAAPLIKRYGIVKWTQTIQPAGFRKPLRDSLQNNMGRSAWTVPDYDLVTTYWLKSLDDMHALTMDPEWAELEKDASTKSNMSIGHFVVGHEIIHFEGNNSTADA
ncbi:hypothetical protein PFICI_04034 [Pestalotiopsis fici W106-1]|uniref:EthD domain-containing protein n=1 Tax=Pestalotiopsis fici (strain W106-1 / CGMCC3.15140) TaxID=1229662 RepID=W3XJ14_PESFW|nr:uncharacterized protein PFICI_04034 [Pestalotiopsis fici W106-1]ETS86009.1 hypothetical protein PFICI_04034 [Pestalotiopsis fici W106-1]